MMIKRRQSWYKIRKIIECFVLDLRAKQTSYLLKLNRKTINLWDNKFRDMIYKEQYEKFKEKERERFEVDESYFGMNRIDRRRKGEGHINNQ